MRALAIRLTKPNEHRLNRVDSQIFIRTLSFSELRVSLNCVFESSIDVADMLLI